MKYLLLTFLTSIISSSGYDPDKKAFSLLNSMSDNYKKMKSFSTRFTYSMINLTENISDSFEGKIFIKGEKYVLYIEDQKIINDSKTSWTYLDDLNEVTISEFDASEQEISLSNIFDIYKNGFDYKYIGEEDKLNIIELYPQDKSKTYYKIVFKIDLNNLLHSFSIYDNTNSTAISNSDRMMVELQYTSNNDALNIGTAFQWLRVANEAQTIYLQGDASTSSAVGIQSDANGYNECSWIKI